MMMICNEHSGLVADVDNLKNMTERIEERIYTLLFLVIGVMIEIPILVFL